MKHSPPCLCTCTAHTCGCPSIRHGATSPVVQVPRCQPTTPPGLTPTPRSHRVGCRFTGAPSAPNSRTRRPLRPKQPHPAPPPPQTTAPGAPSAPNDQNSANSTKLCAPFPRCASSSALQPPSPFPHRCNDSSRPWPPHSSSSPHRRRRPPFLPCPYARPCMAGRPASPAAAAGLGLAAGARLATQPPQPHDQGLLISSYGISARPCVRGWARPAAQRGSEAGGRARPARMGGQGWARPPSLFNGGTSYGRGYVHQGSAFWDRALGGTPQSMVPPLPPLPPWPSASSTRSHPPPLAFSLPHPSPLFPLGRPLPPNPRWLAFMSEMIMSGFARSIGSSSSWGMMRFASCGCAGGGGPGCVSVCVGGSHPGPTSSSGCVGCFVLFVLFLLLFLLLQSQVVELHPHPLLECPPRPPSRTRASPGWRGRPLRTYLHGWWAAARAGGRRSRASRRCRRRAAG
jgi:hypothetical protein